jgi:hypothetical protein
MKRIIVKSKRSGHIIHSDTADKTEEQLRKEFLAKKPGAFSEDELEIIVEDVTAELAEKKAKQEARAANREVLKSLVGKKLSAAAVQAAIQALIAEAMRDD